MSLERYIIKEREPCNINRRNKAKQNEFSNKRWRGGKAVIWKGRTGHAGPVTGDLKCYWAWSRFLTRTWRILYKLNDLNFKRLLIQVIFFSASRVQSQLSLSLRKKHLSSLQYLVMVKAKDLFITCQIIIILVIFFNLFKKHDNWLNFCLVRLTEILSWFLFLIKKYSLSLNIDSQKLKTENMTRTRTRNSSRCVSSRFGLMMSS